MIALIGELVRNLIVLIFVTAILELLMPQGQFQSYLRMVSGLVVILLVVNFISSLTGRLPERGFAVALPAGEAMAPQTRGEELGQFSSRQVLETYRASLADYFKETVEQEGWRLVSLDFTIEENRDSNSFGEIHAATLVVEGASAAQEGLIEPVLVKPVRINHRESSSQEEVGLGRFRVPDLEGILTNRLQLPAGVIAVFEN